MEETLEKYSYYNAETLRYEDVAVIGKPRGEKGKGRVTIEFLASGEQRIVPLSRLEEPLETDVNSRFEYYHRLSELTIRGKLKSLIVVGKGGIGKDYVVEKALEMREMSEDKDYVKIKGHCTPLSLYEQLESKPEGLFIFSDCDSVLKDGTSLNILKAVLDTYSRRYVKWLSSKSARSGFEFKGSIIFISNMDIEDFDQAMISRSAVVNLAMSVEETIQRMRHLLPAMDCVSLSLEDRTQVMDMLDKYKNNVRDLNMRTLIKALVTFEKSGGDAGLTRYQILNG